MKLAIKEVYIQGEPVSRGIAIGKPFFFLPQEEQSPVYTISEEQVDREILRYRSALHRCKVDVSRIKGKLEREALNDPAAILETHLALLQDAMLTEQVENEIRYSCRNAEASFEVIVGRIEEKFQLIPNPFFRERFRDVKDIARRIVGHLAEGDKPCALLEAPPDCILFAHELPISSAAEIEVSHIKAFVTAVGGSTSHAAIIARAKGLPCVTSIDLALVSEYKEYETIVDGRTGEVILNPAKTTRSKYESTQKQLKGYIAHLSMEKRRRTETIDGHQVRLSANLETVNEVDRVQEHGVGGIGLFRSEYLLLANHRVPSEEHQTEVYSHLASRLKGNRAVIRVFDIAGDKALEIRDFAHHQFKGLSGYRSLRFLLEEKQILKAQLRAILKASALGNLAILFPMVTALEELQAAREMVAEAMSDLDQQGIEHAKKCPIGCMVEVPAAVAIVDSLVRESDFLSIGTNDLVQYSLASSRLDYDSGPTSSPAHPAIIRMIKQVVTHANSQRIPVTVCGEMAADPRYTALLVGLGLSELSVACNALPIIKKAIRSTNLVDALALADKILGLGSAVEVENLLCEEYRRTVPEDQYHNCSHIT